MHGVTGHGIRSAPGPRGRLRPAGSGERSRRPRHRAAAPAPSGRSTVGLVEAQVRPGCRRSDPGVFGTIPPVTSGTDRRSRGECFLLDPLGLPPPLTASLPRAGRAIASSGVLSGRVGLGRTIRHRHSRSSNGFSPALPGGLHNDAGQGVTGFPAVDRESRRTSARRSDSSRSRSADP